jgi:hypothetical protein
MVSSTLVEASVELKSQIRNRLRSKFQHFQRVIPTKWLLEKEPEHFEDEDDDYYDDKNMENILFTVDFQDSLDRRQFLSMVAISEHEILKIAKATVGQMRNTKYCLLRKFRLTSSNFGFILSAIRRNRYPPSLYKRLLGAYNLEKVSRKGNVLNYYYCEL